MASTGGMNNLTTLIKRLEAATSRLEDIASSTSSLDTSKSNKPGTTRTVGEYDNLGTPTPAGTTANKELGATSGTTSAPPAAQESLNSVPVRAFDYLVDNELKAFGELGSKIGGLVGEQAALFISSFMIQREVILISDKAKEPSQTSSIIQEILKKGQDVATVLVNNPKSPKDNQLQMCAAGINIIGWVIPGTGLPADFISMMEESAEYYGNQVLKTFKGELDADYVRAFRQLCKSLKDFAKQSFPKGIQWKKDGVSPEEALASVRNGSGAQSSAAPPPPPLPKFDDMPPPPPAQSGTRSGGDMNAMFGELNKGEGVTKGLRKVQASEMTHKNPALRTQNSDVPVVASQGPPGPKAKSEAVRQKRPASQVLDGNRWTIENYEDVTWQNPIRIDAERQQSILISRCNSSVIQVVGKANAISIDNCSRLRLIVDDLVASMEVVNSSRVLIDINGSLPSVQLDKVDGATVALSQKNAANKLWPEIFTSKCTSINIGLGLESEEGSIELPVPEQIRSRIENGKLVNEIVRIDA